MSAHPEADRTPAHITRTFGSMTCSCGQGIPLRGMWPKQVKRMVKAFLAEHAEFGEKHGQR